MENNLTSMVAFVLEHSDPNSKEYKIAKFLSQPLQLGFFVPCDLDGNVLVEPNLTEENFESENPKVIAHYQAQERVLFEGLIAEKKTDWFIVKIDKTETPVWVSWNNSKTIEDLIQHNLTLTASALNSLKA